MRNIFKIILILQFFFLIAITGCVSQYSSENVSDAHLYEISLKNVLSALGLVDDIETTVPLNSIIYIKGRNVSIDGTAEEWIIGLKGKEQNFIYVFNKNGISKITWFGPLPKEILKIHDILFPEDLFKKRPLFLQDITNGGERKINEIEIYDNTYHFSLKRGGEIKEYKFNALTGEDIY